MFKHREKKKFIKGTFLKMKLNAFIAAAGVCSRRKAAQLIKEGVVTLNGTIFLDPAYNVLETDAIVVAGRRIRKEEKIYIVLNKPKGCITTVCDERNRQTVMDLITGIKERLYPVGRLDRATTGVLILTNDGQLAQKLAHPRHGIAKMYHVVLNEPLTQKAIDLIKKGVYLEDGKVVIDELSFCDPTSTQYVRIVIHSGKNRVIRRLFEFLGYKVKDLDRVGYGDITHKGLTRGAYRPLTKREVDALTKS